MDIAPASKGHVLIIPKEHFKDIYEIDAITAGKLFQLATVVARALKEVLHCDGLNVLQNNGLIAGQTVYHFHMHLIPRYEGDDVTIGWKEHSTEDIDMEQLRQDIKRHSRREIWQKLHGNLKYDLSSASSYGDLQR